MSEGFREDVMGNALGLTIAICTWNRATSLRNTLVSLQQLNLPPEIDLEVLIINNNCTDNTEMIVNQLSSSLPLRLLHKHDRDSQTLEIVPYKLQKVTIFSGRMMTSLSITIG